ACPLVIHDTIPPLHLRGRLVAGLDLVLGAGHEVIRVGFLHQERRGGHDHAGRQSATAKLPPRERVSAAAPGMGLEAMLVTAVLMGSDLDGLTGDRAARWVIPLHVFSLSYSSPNVSHDRELTLWKPLPGLRLPSDGPRQTSGHEPPRPGEGQQDG